MTRHFCWHQNFVPCIKSWKNCIKSDFKEIFLKLATNDRSDKMFLLTSNFRPQGVVSTYPGAIYMYKIMKKNVQTSERFFFFKLVAIDRSDKRFLLTSKFCPMGLSAGDLRLYTFIKSWKMCIVRGWKLATNDHSVDIKLFALNGLCVPAQGLCTCIKSWKKCMKSEGRAIFWNMQPVIKVIRPFCLHQNNCSQGLSLLALGLFIHVSNKTK